MNRKLHDYNVSVIIEKDESGQYIGTVPSLKSCYTYAKTLPSLYKRLDEVIALCLEVERDIFKKNVHQNEFVGVHTVKVKMR